MSVKRQPLVSIIIPCYNYAQFLPQTLNSLIDQNYHNWECIIVNDGSTDNTEAVVKQFSFNDKRFRYIYQQNLGQSATRNNGIRYSKGDYIQFLDADDLLESHKLYEQVNFLEQNKEVDIVYGRAMYFNQSTAREDLLMSRSGENRSWMREISGKGLVMIDAFIEDNVMEFGSLLFRRQTIQEIGYLDEKIQGVEDWDYCFRCALSGKKFKFKHFEDTVCLMRHHPNSFSKGFDKMLRAKINLRFKINKMLAQLGQYNEQLQANEIHLQKLLEIEGKNQILVGNIFIGFLRYFYLGLKKKELSRYLKRAGRLIKQYMQDDFH